MRYMLLCSGTQLEIQPSRRGGWEARRNQTDFNFQTGWIHFPPSTDPRLQKNVGGPLASLGGKSKAHFSDSRGSNDLKNIFNKYNMQHLRSLNMTEAGPGSLCSRVTESWATGYNTQCVVGMFGVSWWTSLWLELGSTNSKKHEYEKTKDI